VTAARGLPLAAAMRVIHRVHGNAAIVRRLAQPARAPRLASDTFSWSTLPTCPMVAMQSSCTRRVSPEGSFSSAMPPSLETNCACEPADRAICPPLPGFNSMLWTMVPAGIFFKGRALPNRMSASGRTSPSAHLQFVGLQDVALLAIGVVHRAIRDERLGSYSTDATTAGIPTLSRLKSTTRYACLAPPR